MARAGHADFKTTLGYIDLAGERFRAEAELRGRADRSTRTAPARARGRWGGGMALTVWRSDPSIRRQEETL
jgi:hypothetical protein